MSSFLSEEKIAERWNEKKVFEQTLKESKENPEFVFYDGPPFATGSPHYGHLVGSTIKDIFGRYKTQTGHYVERVFGFDTHGVPIEFEIEKELKIKSVQDIKKLGIANYNEACRSIVMRCKDEWVKTMCRLGRWVDMKNDYKTMDANFMESVWWVFAQLYKKGFVYRGYKVCPYSMGCATPLSNFESKENYKDTSDFSITVVFPLVNQANTNVLVWTTTPWTLPANLMLCVNPRMRYHYVEYENQQYIVEETCTTIGSASV
jgi:isoleucyl-tRNA synthetase